MPKVKEALISEVIQNGKYFNLFIETAEFRKKACCFD